MVRIAYSNNRGARRPRFFTRRRPEAARDSISTIMGRRISVAAKLLGLAPLALGLAARAQVETEGSAARARRQACPGGAGEGSRRFARRQLGRQRRRPRRHRLPAARLRRRGGTALPGRLCSARLLDRRRAVVSGNPCAADHRGRVRPRRSGNDRRAAGLENRAQRLDVFELRHHGRLREFHRARLGRLCRRSLPNHRRAREPRAGRPLPWAAMARRASA